MKVFQINECDCYMAETLEEAIQAAMADTGLPRDEVTDEPREVPPEDMARRKYTDEDGTKRTFAEQLAIDLAGPQGTKPRMFCSTEY